MPKSRKLYILKVVVVSGNLGACIIHGNHGNLRTNFKLKLVRLNSIDDVIEMLVHVVGRL